VRRVCSPGTALAWFRGCHPVNAFFAFRNSRARATASPSRCTGSSQHWKDLRASLPTPDRALLHILPTFSCSLLPLFLAWTLRLFLLLLESHGRFRPDRRGAAAAETRAAKPEEHHHRAASGKWHAMPRQGRACLAVMASYGSARASHRKASSGLSTCVPAGLRLVCPRQRTTKSKNVAPP